MTKVQLWAACGGADGGACAPVERDLMNASKKTFAVVASATAAVLVGGGVAVAYWTTTGTGTGSATAGTTASLVVTQTTATPTGLYPGGPASSLDLSVSNPGTSAVRIFTLTAAPTGTSNEPGCLPANFATTPITVPGAGVLIGPGASVSFPAATTVALQETGVDQNACKNATVTITYSVS